MNDLLDKVNEVLSAQNTILAVEFCCMTYLHLLLW